MTGNGKLIAQGTKRLIDWVNAKGAALKSSLKQGEVSAPLQAMLNDAKQVANLDGKEVEFEIVSGQPRQVRLKGEPFVTLGTASASAPNQKSTPGQPARSTQQTTGQKPQTSVVQQPPEFHNPYNFIPALPRAGLSGELGDHAPVGHHRYHDDRITGSIRVRMTVQTPLLIPDAAASTTDKEGHKTFSTRLGPNGRPHLAPTSIKGMLRSAYEAITNSRLAVFRAHERRLAYRRQARTDVEPAIVESVTEDRFVIRLLSL